MKTTRNKNRAENNFIRLLFKKHFGSYVVDFYYNDLREYGRRRIFKTPTSDERVAAAWHKVALELQESNYKDHNWTAWRGGPYNEVGLVCHIKEQR